MNSLAPSAALRPPLRDPRRPEILAPAGNEEMMRAAVENGADAIYFGLQQFNARLRAANFDIADLPRIMAWLHERGAKGYVTLNTLIFEPELDDAAAVLRACSDAGVDAVLVQDLGLAALCNRLVPELPVHASTQMTHTGAETVEAVEALGLRLERIVAARELSRRELKKMAAALPGREIEVFVHGAICVAYSGQCLTSEALGGRSANRGECAQACRLPYDLVVDGEVKDAGDLKYVLSPKDLCAFEDIGDLIGIGIVSLKIEGRLKSPQYVAATVRSYRDAIDQALASADGTPAQPHLSEERRRVLEMTFSRGFTRGYIHETNHQAVVEGRFPKKRGLFLGRVSRVTPRGIDVALEGPLKPGDGVVFDTGRPDTEEEGGRVWQLLRRGRAIEGFDPLTEPPRDGEVTLTFGEGTVRPHRVPPGALLWKTSDPAMDAELAATFAGDRIRFRRPVRARVQGRPGAPLRLELEDWEGNTVAVEDTAPAEHARHRPLTEAVLAEQLGRLGNTPFELHDIEVDLDGSLMVPLSRLNDLRRRAADALAEKRRAIGRGRAVHPEALAQLRAARRTTPAAEATELSVLCRTLGQVRAIAGMPEVSTIYTDFEDIRLHREARAAIPRGGPQRFVPATLCVVKPGEGPFVTRLLDAEPDALLVRTLAAQHLLRGRAPGLELIGDFSLNVANSLAASLLFAHGFRTLTPSYDLNIGQLLAMLEASDAARFEVVAHQYMPMFHMEHCVFCKFMSTGTDFTNCGRPCESHRLALRDRVGYEHVVKADAGCRNTVFNAVAQSASEYLGDLRRAGVRRFRVELLEEDADRAREAVTLYARALAGDGDGRELWRRLRAKSKLGVTRGPLDRE
jgi:putative protease